MDKPTLTPGHSPDSDDALMFYAPAKELIPTHGCHPKFRSQGNHETHEAYEIEPEE
jgi:hypothetical protein